MGQEGGEDDRSVPDNVTSPTTSSGWVEGSTIASGPTTHHEGGGEYECCVDRSSIARMASLDNRDDVGEQAQMNRQASGDDDDQTTLYGDKDDDEGVQDDLMTGPSHETLTPSSGQSGGTMIAVADTGDAMGLKTSGGPDIAKETDDMVMDRRQTCGLVDSDSREEEFPRGQEDRGVLTMFVESGNKEILMPSSGAMATTADTGKHTPSTSKTVFWC